jgi:hypothetical protein
MRRRGVHTRQGARRCYQTNIWPKRGECGFSWARWNWCSTAPRIPLDKVLFSLRERGLVRNLCQLELALLQFIHGVGQLLWVGVCLQHSFGRAFSVVSMVSINLGIWFYCDAGESIEREESQ